jgi:magnesium chelatase subunit I
MIYIPELARDLLEQIGFEARKSEYVDAKSGVSARMSITAFENLISTAERRLLMSGEAKTSIRMSDFLGIIAAINGKVELVYEGEQEGAEQIAFHLINQAVKTLFPSYFPELKKLEKQDEDGPYDRLLGWFYGDNELFLEDSLPDDVYRDTLDAVPNLNTLVSTHQPKSLSEDKYFLMEFLLWGLEANKRLNKYRTLEGFQFKDGLGNLLAGL